MKTPDIRTGAALIAATATIAALGHDAVKDYSSDNASTPTSLPYAPASGDWTYGHEDTGPKDGKPLKRLWGGDPRNDLGPVRNHERLIEEQERINQENEAGDYTGSDAG